MNHKKAYSGPLWAALPLLALLAGCSEEEELPVFQMVPVSIRDIVVSASAAGIIEPVTTVEVKSKASGEIFEVRVETGDVVKAGDLLTRVDPRVPRATLRQAEADLELAKAQLEVAQSQLGRAEDLFENQSITETEYENATLAAASAQASLVRAERNVEDSRISFEDTDVRAPSNGVIIQRNVEPGTVISSAMSNVGGGTVLLQMANLDTVQIRALVDETDIGKIQPGMEVTITVEAYPNRPFRGRVLKIEPQAEVTQNVTMFPVLVRIANPESLLKPGMNAEVEVHVGERRGVVAVPNGALRTERDWTSAAMVLGLDEEAVRQQLADARQAQQEGQGSFGGSAATDGQTDSTEAGRETCNMQGREFEPPEGVTCEQISAVFRKMREHGGPQALDAGERQVLQKMRSAMGGQGQGRRQQQSNEYLFGGNYVVFTLVETGVAAVPVRTGLTDLDFSEVITGLTEADTVLLLPSASLLASQQEWQDRMNRVRSRSLPGVSRN
jgi:HlyD family secretion protein